MIRAFLHNLLLFLLECAARPLEIVETRATPTQLVELMDVDEVDERRRRCGADSPFNRRRIICSHVRYFTDFLFVLLLSLFLLWLLLFLNTTQRRYNIGWHRSWTLFFFIILFDSSHRKIVGQWRAVRWLAVKDRSFRSFWLKRIFAVFFCEYRR